jgi:NhaA family Na+:H+ antiporter
VAFGVMPLFALVNSGVELGGLSAERIGGGVAVGTAVALLAGKLAGVFAFTAAAVRLGLAPIPGGAGWTKLLGVSAVSGIGFTVALFIAGLAFADQPGLLDEAKVGILAGSLAAGVVGALVLRATPVVR